MKNPIISASSGTEVINLRNFPRLLSRRHTWSLVDQKLDIWHTFAIPGESMMSDAMLEELYSSYGVYWLFGEYVEIGYEKRCAVIKAINMYDCVQSGNEFIITMDDVGGVHGVFPGNDHLISFGTILFADPTIRMNEGLAAKIINCSEESPYIFSEDEFRSKPETNELDEIFARSDKPLENLFLDDFNKLYHKYAITNRGGDMETVLKRIADKLLY